jgi:Transposase DDE domain group 1
VSAIACGCKDAIDLDRLRHDPLMKVTVGRCPQTGAPPLASQSAISRLENAPSKTDAARLGVAMLDQFCAKVKPGRVEILDIDDTFCAAHGGQQLAFLERAPASRRCTSIRRVYNRMMLGFPLRKNPVGVYTNCSRACREIGS